MGIRFTICAISKEKCEKSSKIIKEVIDFVNKKN